MMMVVLSHLAKAQSYISVQVDDLWLYTESEKEGVIKDPCKGDSGGPLIVDNGGQPLLVGVLKVTPSLLYIQSIYGKV